MIQIIVTIFIVLYRIPLINILGDKGMGYYSVALAVYLLLMTCIAYGLPKAVAEDVAEQYSKGQYRLLYETVKSSFLFVFLTGGISALVLFSGADLIAGHLLGAAYSSYALRAFAPGLVFVSVLGVLHGIYTGTRLGRVSKTAYRIEELLVAVCSVLFAYFFGKYGETVSALENDILLKDSYGALGASLGLVLGVFAACAYMLMFYKNFHKKIRRMAEKDAVSVKVSGKELIWKLFISMLPFVAALVIFHLSSLLDYGIYNRIMKVQGHKESSYMILLGMLNGKYEFFISLPLLIVNWFVGVKFSLFRQIAQDGNKRKMQVTIGQNVRTVMLFVIPWTMFYCVFALPLMNLLFIGNNVTASAMLRIGAVSIVFYSLASISNVILNALDDWLAVAKNALIALGIQTVFLLIAMIIFQWGIWSVVISRALFSASIFILNEHLLRERTGYVQEHKRTFTIPLLSALIMGVVAFLIYSIMDLFFLDKISVIVSLILGVLIYILALVFLGGITQHEMYRLPGGKYLAPLCRKLHLIK